MIRRKALVLVPNGWPCRLDDAPPGLCMFKDSLIMKTEYSGTAGVDVYIVSSGEFFHGGTNGDYKARAALEVQPLAYEWQEVEG